MQRLLELLFAGVFCVMGKTILRWSTPIFMEDLNESELLAHLKHAALYLEKNEPSSARSQHGGFQSRIFDADDLEHDQGALHELSVLLKSHASRFVAEGLEGASDGGLRMAAWEHGAEHRLEIASLWFNVNRAGAFNRAHTHSDCFLGGIFYVATPGAAADDDSAAAVFLDPRPQTFSSWHYADWFGAQRNEIIDPVPGRLVFFPCWLSHRVEPVPLSAGDQPRISVSFNIRIIKSAGNHECI